MNAPAATVTEIWRYPVKSLGGEALTSVRVSSLGIDGDRSWGLVDPTTGYVLTARREPRLLYLRARWTTAGPIITTADGEQLDNSTELSRWLDRPVVLTAAGAEGGTYENPLDVERDEDWVSWQGPGGAWHDNVDMQISLVTTRSLGTWEPQRFRINLIIRDEGQLDWGAATLRVGSATLVPSRPIERCVMVTRAQPGIARDLDVLRTIRKTTGTFGHGATIHQAGTITVGDHIS